MENYSSSWETQLLMKMAVVSMEKPSGALPVPPVFQRDSVPVSWPDGGGKIQAFSDGPCSSPSPAFVDSQELTVPPANFSLNASAASGDEIEPVLEPGEVVVFLAHFERGFGLPASDFFRQFLDFYRLQPHHLPGNAVFYLSCFVAFMEGYIGIRPARETFARFFSLRINSVQGKDIPKPKPPVQCGSCIIGSRQGSPFFKFNGLESCRLWQTTFFYVKNKSATDLINLPAFNPAPPAKINWNYNPGTDHIETNRVVRFMLKLMKETNICSDDIIRTFICRRVLPLKRRAHKISEMPRTVSLISSRSARPRKRLGQARSDPFVPWYDLKMGRIPTRPTLSQHQPQVHEHVAPLQAEVGDEFPTSSCPSKKNKAPAADAEP
ncbi:hypothetical protein QYE76_028391 [Lolium multiflorum]|uniref:Transposase (putative) gypsy type domain-containing protein n=1 Tax=Lolium multiflorum TaxID=4521 RepID=A0AAD8QKX6_LOLMU|nr:hypothetical protein QYE76_028391 [Lolium multiflorum]